MQLPVFKNLPGWWSQNYQTLLTKKYKGRCCQFELPGLLSSLYKRAITNYAAFYTIGGRENKSGTPGIWFNLLRFILRVGIRPGLPLNRNKMVV